MRRGGGGGGHRVCWCLVGAGIRLLFTLGAAQSRRIQPCGQQPFTDTKMFKRLVAHRLFAVSFSGSSPKDCIRTDSTRQKPT